MLNLKFSFSKGSSLDFGGVSDLALLLALRLRFFYVPNVHIKSRCTSRDGGRKWTWVQTQGPHCTWDGFKWGLAIVHHQRLFNHDVRRYPSECQWLGGGGGREGTGQLAPSWRWPACVALQVGQVVLPSLMDHWPDLTGTVLHANCFFAVLYQRPPNVLVASTFPVVVYF